MSEIVSNTKVKMGSEKSFGLVFAAVLLIIALFPLLSANHVRLWALGVAAVFAVLAYLRPSLLAPLNRVWFLFGLLLHKIISPVVMGIVFFLTVTPVGLIMRLMGKDPLSQSFDQSSESYWILIPETKTSESSMRNQF